MDRGRVFAQAPSGGSMSPMEHWKNAFRVEDMRLPVDAGELEIVCCEWDTALVSHIGIEKANCVFNSAALQDLRRRHPGPDDLSLEIKWNKTSMRHIWVLDATTGEWISVPNRDAKKAAMSAAEVAMAKKLAQLPEDVAAVVARVASRKARHALAAELAPAKKRMKGNALKKLGLTTQSSDQETPPSAASKPADPSTSGAGEQPSPATMSEPATSAQDDAEAPMKALPSPAAVSIPIFNFIRPASSASADGRPA